MKKEKKRYIDHKETVCLRLSKTILAELREYAFERGVSANFYIAALVREYFLKEKAKEKKAA